MGERLFTTGQAAAVADISTKTLERYIKNFGEYFTQGATINRRGRRYTGDDMRAILFIHRLYGHRLKRDAIEAALKDGSHEEEVQHFELDEAGQLLLTALRGMDLAEETNKAAIKRLNFYNDDMGYVTREIVKLRNEVAAYRRQIDLDIETLDQRLRAAEKRLQF